MKIHLYVTLRVEVETELNLLDCIQEFENGTDIKICDTPGVQVLEREILLSVLPGTKD
jgi:hypothetical protein